jgi:uncharacterized protein
MSFKDELKKKIMQAMREKKQAELTALRQIKAEVMKVETSGSVKELDEEGFIKVLNSLAKQHQESIEIYKSNGRDEQVEQEELELAVIKSFLPEEMGDSEVEALVAETITELGASTKKDMGPVMKSVKDKIATQNLMVDGRKLSEAVKAKLQ